MELNYSANTSDSSGAPTGGTTAKFLSRFARRRPHSRGAMHFGSLTGHSMFELKTIGLFFITAIAEILGCYLPYLWLKEGKSAWLLVPAAASLTLFAWLLSLHPTAAGRVYAAYGGVYIFVAILWLWSVDGIRPTAWDLIGSAVALVGMAIIMFAPRSA